MKMHEKKHGDPEHVTGHLFYPKVIYCISCSFPEHISQSIVMYLHFLRYEILILRRAQKHRVRSVAQKNVYVMASVVELAPLQVVDFHRRALFCQSGSLRARSPAHA